MLIVHFVTWPNRLPSRDYRNLFVRSKIGTRQYFDNSYEGWKRAVVRYSWYADQTNVDVNHFSSLNTRYNIRMT